MDTSNRVVICGAGIAGISAAYHLAVRRGFRQVLICDANPPLSLTSDKSTECYRNWWPGPGDAMVVLMNRSIDLMEELAQQSGNSFHLSRRGYLYLTGDAGKIPALMQSAQQISELGGGPLRVYTGSAHDPYYQPAPASGFTGQPEGADLFLDPALLRRYYPYLSPQVASGLHVRRAGWFSAQQLGTYLLDQARARGVELLHARVQSVETRAGRVRAVRLGDGSRMETEIFVNAAGPLVKEVGRMLGIELPVHSELHLKAAFKDTQATIPRHAPLLIWTDPQRLPWSDQERQFLAESPQTRWLLQEMPPGVHTRPEGGDDSPIILMLWEYRTQEIEPAWPIPLDPDYAEIVLRGLSTMLPGLRAYFNRLGRPYVDGGYYTKTPENRPLIGPLPVEGAYIIGALSGFGLMASCAAGELLAAHAAGSGLPAYAPAFSLSRYDDPAYLAQWEEQSETGQL